MSRTMVDTSKRRARRQFTDEFKASAVPLVIDLREPTDSP